MSSKFQNISSHHYDSVKTRSPRKVTGCPFYLDLDCKEGSKRSSSRIICTECDGSGNVAGRSLDQIKKEAAQFTCNKKAKDRPRTYSTGKPNVFNMLYAILLLFSFISCAPSHFANDSEYPVAASVNSPEFPVYVNGIICKDMDSITGFCTKRIANTGFKLTIDPRPYPYKVAVTCNTTIPFSKELDAPGNAHIDIVVDASYYKGQDSFACLGQIFPIDGRESVSSKFDIRFRVVGEKYAAREEIYEAPIGSTPSLILGDYALHSTVCGPGGCRQYSKAPYVTLDKFGHTYAYSESYQMRFNYYEAKGEY